MLEAINSIGEILDEEGKKNGDTVNDLIQRKKIEQTKTVLSIVVKNDTYNQIRIEDKKVDHYDKYLYVGGPANGPDLTPTSILNVKINKNDKKKYSHTFEKKILAWFEAHSDKENILGIISIAMQKDADRIDKDILTKFQELDKKKNKNVLLTVVYVDNMNNELYPGDIDAVKSVLRKNFSARGSEFKCSLCGGQKQVVDRSQLSRVFSFATIDKPGFTYGFDTNSSWALFPVCQDCFAHLTKGYRWIEENSNFKLAGHSYFVIPHSSDRSALKRFKKEAESGAKREEGQAIKKYEYHLLNQEQDFLEDLEESGTEMGLNFLFYSKLTGGKYIKIERYIYDVPLTWLHDIYEKSNAINKMTLFTEASLQKLFGHKWEGDYKDRHDSFVKSLAMLYNSANSASSKMPNEDADKSKGSWTATPAFLETLGAIFEQRSIPFNLLIKVFAQAMKQQYTERGNTGGLAWTSLHTVLIYLVFLRLKLISRINSKSIMSSDHDIPEDLIELLNTPAKKAIFLLGALTGRLLNSQKNVRQATPFASQLRDLNINYSYAKALFPRVVGKLQEYERLDEKLRYKDIQQNAAKNFLEAENESLNSDETSYYFALGLSLHWLI